MKDTGKVFYDGMENIRLTDGVIHLEFYNLTRSGNEEKKEPAGEIVLSQQAFLRAFSAMENLVAQLEKAGMVKRRSPENTKPAPGDGGGAAVGGSPNFQ
jgi:hypothetical protein